jgi:cell division protein FtsQ
LTSPEALPIHPPVAAGSLPKLLRWLIALGVVAGSVAGAVALLRHEPAAMPVRVVSVDGAVRRLSVPVLARTVTEHLQSGILTQDLDTLREAVEALPWVRTASLRRIWPDRIQLSVTEHQPLARWGEDGLATAEGVVFRPKDEVLPTGLPHLESDDAQAPRVVAQYLNWRDRLATLGLSISTLVMDARGAWSLDLKDGLRIELGTERVEERLTRFIRTWPQLAAAGRPDQVDLRYANGLAVRWAKGGAPGDAALAQTEAAAAEADAMESKGRRNQARSTGTARNKSHSKG